MTWEEFSAQTKAIADAYSQEHNAAVLCVTTGGPTGFCGASAFHGCTKRDIWHFIAALQSMEQSARDAFLDGSDADPEDAIRAIDAEAAA
jgi:hypothetical protein